MSKLAVWVLALGLLVAPGVSWGYGDAEEWLPCRA